MKLPGKMWAVKESLAEPGTQKAVQDEAQLLIKLSHPRLPRIVDYFHVQSTGYIYLVMDFIQGMNLIMIAVFASFIFVEDVMIKSMGLALAFGILFDAFIVRLTIVPAVMTLMGRSAWYLPKWLGRILPNIDVEGETIEKEPKSKKEIAS